jgi:hypothetical protein
MSIRGQSTNADPSISLVAAGIAIEFKRQPEKARPPILFRFEGSSNVIDDIPKHSSKHRSPIISTDDRTTNAAND